MPFSAKRIKQKARDLGFNLVGLTRAEPSPTLAAYKQWIAQGMHGKMGYMARDDRVIRRDNLDVVLPGAQSLIMVGLDYRTLTVLDDVLNNPARGRIASYAWGLDYHDLIEPRLEAFAEWLHDEASETIDHKVYVDTGAILERSHAQQAGMGFIGKNTMLIHPRRGSYFFLGEIITSLTFDDYDTPHKPTMCGTCTRCLQACPTDAFPKPHVLDARRCISYHTIENKGWIDRALRPQFGNWVFGCDICQDVCPFQRFSQTSLEADFFPESADTAAPHLSELLTLTDDSFRERYRGSPVYRIRRKRMVRNACIAAGNSLDPQFIPYLIQLLYDDDPLVRGHAVWGLWRIMGIEAIKQINELYYREDNPDVRTEIEAIVP